MSKRKTPDSKFILDEANGVVTASLIDENDYSLQHTITCMPHPRIRAPRRTKEQIREDSKFLSSVLHYDSQEEYLKNNIKSVNQEINKHVQEIRKTLKRMQSLTHYVINAQEVLDEIEKNT